MTTKRLAAGIGVGLAAVAAVAGGASTALAGPAPAPAAKPVATQSTGNGPEIWFQYGSANSGSDVVPIYTSPDASSPLVDPVTPPGEMGPRNYMAPGDEILAKAFPFNGAPGSTNGMCQDPTVSVPEHLQVAWYQVNYWGQDAYIPVDCLKPIGEIPPAPTKIQPF